MQTSYGSYDSYAFLYISDKSRWYKVETKVTPSPRRHVFHRMSIFPFCYVLIILGFLLNKPHSYLLQITSFSFAKSHRYIYC